jgi:hypothetical protein
MVECAFGIVCNKWRIFHRAVDVRPDFSHVIVKLVAYCTASFVRETAFSYRVLYTNVPSRLLRLLTLGVMLQERIWEGGLRGRASVCLGPRWVS